MNKALKKKWLAALRSGRYRKGELSLRAASEHGGHSKYCCLGVLCEVSGATWNRGSGTYEYKGYEEWSVLPMNLMKYSDISKSEEEFLVKMNDIDGKSFRQIADWIEENL